MSPLSALTSGGGLEGDSVPLPDSYTMGLTDLARDYADLSPMAHFKGLPCFGMVDPEVSVANLSQHRSSTQARSRTEVKDYEPVSATSRDELRAGDDRFRFPVVSNLRRYFEIGRVVKIPWLEPAGNMSSRKGLNSETASWVKNASVKIRRFEVIELNSETASCVKNASIKIRRFEVIELNSEIASWVKNASVEIRRIDVKGLNSETANYVKNASVEIHRFEVKGKPNSLGHSPSYFTSNDARTVQERPESPKGANRLKRTPGESKDFCGKLGKHLTKELKEPPVEAINHPRLVSSKDSFRLQKHVIGLIPILMFPNGADAAPGHHYSYDGAASPLLALAPSALGLLPAAASIVDVTQTSLKKCQQRNHSTLPIYVLGALILPLSVFALRDDALESR